MNKPGMRHLLQHSSQYQEMPLRNRDRVKGKLTWGKTKWGARDIWGRK